MNYALVGLKTAQTQYNEFRRDLFSPSGLCVVHTAENVTSLVGPDTSAEAVLQFITNRTDYGSYHRLVDSDSIIRLVPWEYETFHCRFTNRWSVGISAAVSCEDWPVLYQTPHDIFPSRGHAIIDLMAFEAADHIRNMRVKYGIEVPPKRITREQALNHEPGFIGHGEIDEGRRSDPGEHFDWGYFFERIASHSGSPVPSRPIIESRPQVSITMASPAEGRISSEFGWRPRISNRIPAMLHAGIDIANKVGTPIYAAFAGKVEKAGWGVVPGRSGYGILIVNPDGEKQYYGHLSVLKVKRGAKVKRGQLIGLMGATGNVTGSHLHFEVWDRLGNPINPRRAFENHGVTPGALNFKASGVPVVKPVSDKTKPSPVPYYNRVIDGDAGKYTWTALQEFLKDKGYYTRLVDGVAGAHTWSALQTFLRDRKLYTRAIDGQAGPHTITALQTFLKKNKWYNRAIDGKAGYWTWRGLQDYLARRTKD